MSPCLLLTALNPESGGHTFLPEDVGVPGQHRLQQHRHVALRVIAAQVVLQLYVLGGDLVKAVDQLGDKVVVPAGQETVDLLGDPPIVQQALSGGGRERGRQGQLV